MTPASTIFRQKKRICYWDSERHLSGPVKIAFEQQLKRLGTIEFVRLKNLEDPAFAPCDLLIIAANQVPENELLAWIKRIKIRIPAQNQIKPPALVLTDIGFATIVDQFQDIVAENWYFDFVAPTQLDSLAIRTANLLRIHDHLHEIFRYDKQLRDMVNRLEEIEQRLQRTGLDKGDRSS